MKIMAINAGSSSLKFQLYKMPSEEVITKGIVERIGEKDSTFRITSDEVNLTETLTIPNHKVAVELLLEKLLNLDIIQSFEEINGIGHRVVHGGKQYNDSVLITEDVLHQIEKLSEFAPLHNPANIQGIRAFKAVLPNIPSVACFDTAFHQTMPKRNYIYSLPYEYYEKFDIRKYGFHGISHKYVSERAASMLGRPIEHLRLITCHIGSGASVTAIQGGESIDTSMGFTPLAGVTMGTRTGDIDAAIIPYIMEKTGETVEEVLNTLNKKSGLLGLSGFSNDYRDLEQGAAEGNERAKLALKVFTNNIQKYIGSYLALMNGADAIVFTAGVGENSASFRERVLNGLEFMGIYLDGFANLNFEDEAIISFPNSPIKVLVIPTDEELAIARDVVKIGNVTDDPVEEAEKILEALEV